MSNIPTVVEPDQVMTKEQFQQALPVTLRKNVNQELVDQVNDVLSDPEMYEVYRDGILGYGALLEQGRFKLSSYVSAVKYVSLKHANHTNEQAYRLTFPEKFQRWAEQGVLPQDISKYVSSYNKSKLVMLIYKQSLVPMWLVNQDNYQKAINVQIDLMNTANSEKVRSDAANSILHHLKPPEALEVELKVGTATHSVMDDLREMTTTLVAQQRKMLQDGTINMNQVAAEPITKPQEPIDAEFSESE